MWNLKAFLLVKKLMNMNKYQMVIFNPHHYWKVTRNGKIMQPPRFKPHFGDFWYVFLFMPNNWFCKKAMFFSFWTIFFIQNGPHSTELKLDISMVRNCCSFSIYLVDPSMVWYQFRTWVCLFGMYYEEIDAIRHSFEVNDLKFVEISMVRHSFEVCRNIKIKSIGNWIRYYIKMAGKEPRTNA